jgi:hypothetical protein
LYRDQAWRKIQFFAGDRAGDLALVVAQEVKILTDGSEIVFQLTFGKTLRGSLPEQLPKQDPQPCRLQKTEFFSMLDPCTK